MTMNNRKAINIIVDTLIENLTTYQQTYQNAVLNGKNITKAKHDLENLISLVDYYLETVHVPFSKDDPLEPLRHAKGQAMYVLINN